MGPTSAVNVVLVDKMPMHTTFWSAMPPVTGITVQPDVGVRGQIIFERFFVPVDVPIAPLKFTIEVLVDPAAPLGTFIDNLATLTSPSDPDPDRAATIVRIGGGLDLSITKTDDQTLTVPGAVLTYTLVVRNAGPLAVTRARVTEPVPATLLGVSWTCTASEGSCCPASGIGAINMYWWISSLVAPQPSRSARRSTPPRKAGPSGTSDGDGAAGHRRHQSG